MHNFLIAISVTLLTSIYTYNITDVNGTTIPLSNFQGKKIMLVNIATGSERVNQLAGLQQLHQQYHDSLVIIAFPSNSFGNESRSNGEIKQFCQNSYNTGFIIAQKNAVTGTGLQPIYSWLSNGTQNGASAITVLNDFQKIIIDKYGDIIGVFAPTVDPADATIHSAITNN